MDLSSAPIARPDRPLEGARRHALIPLAAALWLCGCAAVGPDYDRPPEVATAALQSPSFARAALAPGVDTSAPPPARWWESLPDPLLTRLVDDAFAASPSLQAAVARVRSARAQQAVNGAALGPTGGASGRYVRGRIPTGSLQSSGASTGTGTTTLPDPIDLTSYSVSVDAIWEIDLFGGRRRNIESATAAAQAQQAALEDAQVTLASDMTQAYSRLREAQSRRALAVVAILTRRQTLELTRQRRDGGTAAQGDVERAELALAQAEADVPALETQAEQQLDLIAMLAGRESGAYDALLAVPADASVALPPLPPDAVPVGQPADWLRRRPDIRRAERTLAARNAIIGSDMAALFPSVSLIGFLGTAGSRPGDLFKGGPISLVTPSLTWNFLDLASNRAKVSGAEADRDESLADYRRSVLAALQDANDALSRFGRARESLELRDAARQAATRAAAITRQRFEAGTVSLLDVLDAERQRTQADDQWAQARSTLLIAYASLQKSLGSGWGAPPPPTATAAAGNPAGVP